MKEPKEKETKEKDWGTDELKDLFKDFLLDWKSKKEKETEQEQLEVPVPPAAEKKEEKEEKKEEKKTGFFDWLFG